MTSDKKQDYDTASILSQSDYAGIIYRKNSDAIVRVDDEDGEYKIKDFITTNDVVNTNVAMVEIEASCHNTYNDNDAIYYFISSKICDLMPHSVHSGLQPKILTVEPGSVMFIPKKSDHTFIGSFKAVVITLSN